jgi:iron complex outermembrane receptor protein
MRSKVLQIGLLLALLVPIEMLAQEVAGTVTSGGNPVIGANVSVRALKVGTTTDPDGNYRLKLDPGTYSITFSSVGYKPKTVSVTITAGATTTMDVTLEEAPKVQQEVVIVGGRASARTVTDSPLPIDILPVRELTLSGQNSFDKMLQHRVPSFSTVQTPVNDATALMDPWEIRNMGVSRTLILINGKRKNLSSLVYTQTSPSRGETGVDISAIPVDAIKRVEILRDGASAQYGSDAIAGVVNIVLKDDTEGGYTVLNSGITSKGDGGRVAVALNNGSSLFSGNGFVNYTAEFSRVNEARRSGVVDAAGEAADFGANINDVLNFLAFDKYAGNRSSAPATSAAKFLLNTGINVSDNTEIYGNGAYVYKKVNSFANYRTPYWRTLGDFPYLQNFFGDGTPSSYKGYLPTFDGDLVDYNATIGLRTRKGGWSYDVSYTTGFNNQDYTVLNSHNRSDIRDSASIILYTPNTSKEANETYLYRENSPLVFKPGGVEFFHHVGNIDVAGAVTDQLSVGIGTEFRSETFEVFAGDRASWDGVGADSFAGNRPENSGKFNRYNFGGYLNADFDVTKEFLLSATIRNEYYSDFGNAFVYKISSRVKALEDKLTLRGSYSTGFKAPTLHQIYTQRSQYSFVAGGGIQQIGLLNNVSPEARAVGVKPLQPEEAKNLTFGLGASITEGLNITFDYYNISIDDRIVISGRVPTPTGLGEFFTNSIDTRTSGLDIVIDYKNIELGDGVARFSLAGNINLENKKRGSIPLVAGNPVIDETQEALFFTSRPKQKFILGGVYEMEKWTVSLNNTFFGKTEFKQQGLATDAQGKFLLKTVFDPKIVTDLAFTFQLFNNISIAANINNLFNVIPKWKIEALDAAGQAIVNDPVQLAIQRNYITFNGRYDIMTYDGYHFSQLGRIYNVALTYSL